MTGLDKTYVEKPFGRTNFVGTALIVLALILLAGSMSPSAGGAGSSHALRGRQENRYELKGIVQSVDKAKKRATIKHEKVGDLMGAMTMPFLIKDEKALNEMEPGDQIKGTLVTTGAGGMWLEKITIIAKAKNEKTSTVGGDQADKPSGLMGESGNDRRPPTTVWTWCLSIRGRRCVSSPLCSYRQGAPVRDRRSMWRGSKAAQNSDLDHVKCSVGGVTEARPFESSRPRTKAEADFTR